LSDLENNNISKEDLFELVKNTSIYHFAKFDLEIDEMINIPEGWKVLDVNREDDRIRLSNGRIAGYIPIATKPDSSWV